MTGLSRTAEADAASNGARDKQGWGPAQGKDAAANLKRSCPWEGWDQQYLGYLTTHVILSLKHDTGETQLRGCIIQSGKRFLALCVPGETGQTVIVPVDAIAEIRPTIGLTAPPPNPVRRTPRLEDK